MTSIRSLRSGLVFNHFSRRWPIEMWKEKGEKEEKEGEREET